MPRGIYKRKPKEDNTQEDEYPRTKRKHKVDPRYPPGSKKNPMVFSGGRVEDGLIYDIAKGGYVDLKAANDRIEALAKELVEAKDNMRMADLEASTLRKENELYRRIIDKLLDK